MSELPPGLILSFEKDPSWHDRDFIDEGLGEFNAPFLHDPRYSYFGIFVRDQMHRAACAPDWSAIAYAGWLFISLLWVHGDLRRQRHRQRA